MSFKDYLVESNNISSPELQKKIGMTRMKTMVNHPFYKHYIRDYMGLHPVAYIHSKGSLGHQVQSSADGKTMVSFDFYNYKVTNAHLYRWDGQSRHLNGRKMWNHVKSYKEDE